MLFSAMIGVIVSFSHNRFQFQFDVSVSSRVGLVGGVEDLSVLVTLIRIYKWTHGLLVGEKYLGLGLVVVTGTGTGGGAKNGREQDIQLQQRVGKKKQHHQEQL